MTKQYSVRDYDIVVSHGDAIIPKAQRLRDGIERQIEIDAMVASGDCLEALASAIDAVNHNDARHSPELEHVVATLLYLQNKYQLVAKQRNS